MMNDCDNGTVRDALPDWLHGRLTKPDAAAVAAHVANCADCTAEVALLRAVREVLPVPVLQLDRLAERVSAQTRVPAVGGWRLPERWRVAAAAVILVAGGLTWMRWDGGRRGDGAGDPPSAATELAVTPPEAAPLAMVPDNIVELSRSDLATPAELTGTTFDELTDAQLQRLLEELRDLRALPSAEPETTRSLPMLNDSTEEIRR